MSAILQFSYLQLLDLLTTLAFLLHGVQEANPLVKAAMTLYPNPAGGLLLVKLAALALGLACWRLGKHVLLGRVNVFFAALVTWNLVALILGSV